MLAPCSSCRRHVRVAGADREGRCPFCGASCEELVAPAPVESSRRARAWLAAATISTVVVAAGCPNEPASPVPPYGRPPEPTVTSEPTQTPPPVEPIAPPGAPSSGTVPTEPTGAPSPTSSAAPSPTGPTPSPTAQPGPLPGPKPVPGPPVALYGAPPPPITP